MNAKTPKGLRLHIGIFGRQNVGKSSIINCLTEQNTAIVSHYPGTTTDPVEKPMELLQLGPVIFVDTAGIDDVGALGERRLEKTRQVIQRTDFALLVTDMGRTGEFEKDLIAQFEKLDIPFVIVLNKADVSAPDDNLIAKLRENYSVCVTSAETKEGLDKLRQAIIENVPEAAIANPAIVSDLVPPGTAAVLVVPIDKEAPKGRLILPQVQAIRDLLDGDSIAIVCKERELAHTLKMLKEKPSLVVTDSQAFLKVAADTPDDVPMTSFSILFARFKGDLHEMVRGAMAIDSLESGDRVMIAESCTHHPITDDIGTVKIPRWLRQYLGAGIKIDHYRGNDFPGDLEEYKLIIHCGGCMWNRRQMLSRIAMAKQASVPITNYGMAIAYLHGIFERALEPFIEVHDLVE
jgi:[FeFe] hydrogenase H-cluster maturation GTPase HydF